MSDESFLEALAARSFDERYWSRCALSPARENHDRLVAEAKTILAELGVRSRHFGGEKMFRIIRRSGEFEWWHHLILIPGGLELGSYLNRSGKYLDGNPWSLLALKAAQVRSPGALHNPFAPKLRASTTAELRDHIEWALALDRELEVAAMSTSAIGGAIDTRFEGWIPDFAQVQRVFRELVQAAGFAEAALSLRAEMRASPMVAGEREPALVGLSAALAGYGLSVTRKEHSRTTSLVVETLAGPMPVELVWAVRQNDLGVLLSIEGAFRGTCAIHVDDLAQVAGFHLPEGSFATWIEPAVVAYRRLVTALSASPLATLGTVGPLDASAWRSLEESLKGASP